jgi:ABC-2 type transport system ATP-binding protein
MVLDEPFSGLDPLVRDEFISGLLELPADDRPRTFVVSSHDIDEVEKLCDNVGFMAAGRLLVHESADALRGRFRRCEIVGHDLARHANDAVPAWAEVRSPAPNVLQFVHTAFAAGTTERDLTARFPGASVTVRGMTLREIFLILARQQRGAKQTHPQAA